jgi:glycosyltransferase involved in cell wall biosynthesis
MTVSVIIPAYNAARTLSETLVSVLAQTRPADEIIVVDDGSVDGTSEIAAASSGPVRLVRQNNRGAAAALNAGIELATGELFAFIDADDVWDHNKLAKQERFLEERAEIDGVGGHMSTFLCPSNDPGTNKRYKLPVGPQACLLLGALMLRRNCFVRCGTFSESLPVAYSIDWYDRAKSAGLVFGMLPVVVLHRRIHPGSLSHRSLGTDISMLEMARRAIVRRRGILAR